MFAHININKEVEVKGVYIAPQTFYPRIVNVLTVDNMEVKSIYFYSSIYLAHYSGRVITISPERLVIEESSILYLDLIDEFGKERLYLKSDDFNFKGFLTEYQLIELITKDLNY